MLLVSDDLIYYLVIVTFSILFSVLGFVLVPTHGSIILQGSNIDDNEDAQNFFTYGRIMRKIGSILFFVLASAFWFILAILTDALNNCSDTFNVCYTSPTYVSTTVTITQFSWGTIGGYLFALLSVVFLIVTVMAILAMQFSQFSFMDTVIKRKEDAEIPND